MCPRHRSPIDDPMKLLGRENTAASFSEQCKVRHLLPKAWCDGAVARSICTMTARAKFHVEVWARLNSRLVRPASPHEHRGKHAEEQAWTAMSACRKSHGNAPIACKVAREPSA